MPSLTLISEKNVLTFDLISGSRLCVRTENCLHGALHCITFNLISNMTTFRKFFLTICPHPRVEDVCSDRIETCMLLYKTFALI